MGSSLGYEYRRRFWMEDEIILLYKFPLSYGIKSFLFEIRTNFIVTTRPAPAAEDGFAEEMIVDSERYDACVAENEKELRLERKTSYRLKEYWMTDDEVASLAHDAMDFARRMAADHPQLRLIPVVVGLDICTAQQEGEPLVATMDRAIMPEHLIPLYLCLVGSAVEHRIIETILLSYLRYIRRIRVEDINKGFALMQVCGICGRNPTVGDQISVLQCCNHAFHSHCVVRWLEDSEHCPLCNAQAHNYICWSGRASGDIRQFL